MKNIKSILNFAYCIKFTTLSLNLNRGHKLKICFLIYDSLPEISWREETTAARRLRQHYSLSSCNIQYK